MKQESIDILKAEIIKIYRKHGDEPFLATSIRTYTGNEVANEIENETPFGVNCIKTIIGLTIDLLSRNKLKYEPDYKKNIGKKVHKHKSDNPFKSGLKINTVKDVIEHPILHVPAYTFLEDDTYVECRRCEPIEE